MRSGPFLPLALVLALHVDAVIQVLSGHELAHQSFLAVGSLQPTLGLHHFRLDELELGVHLDYVLLGGQGPFVLDDGGGEGLERFPGEHAVAHFDGADAEPALVGQQPLVVLSLFECLGSADTRHVFNKIISKFLF